MEDKGNLSGKKYSNSAGITYAQVHICHDCKVKYSENVFERFIMPPTYDDYVETNPDSDKNPNYEKFMRGE